LEGFEIARAVVLIILIVLGVVIAGIVTSLDKLRSWN
jgi:hypothetical protein